jgi:transposase-like protein
MQFRFLHHAVIEQSVHLDQILSTKNAHFARPPHVHENCIRINDKHDVKESLIAA